MKIGMILHSVKLKPATARAPVVTVLAPPRKAAGKMVLSVAGVTTTSTNAASAGSVVS
jgi:hypothetical protein